MRHPTDGVLRRLLDEPDGVADDDRRHAETCPQCRAELDAVRADADLVHEALVVELDGDRGLDRIDVGRAWERLQATPPSEPTNVVPLRAGRVRRALRSPAAAGVAVAVVLAGAGTAAANDWLPIFRAERVEPVGVGIGIGAGLGALNALPDLDAYGDVDVDGDPDLRQVDDVAAAEAETGLDVPEVDELPRGVVGDPTIRVGDEVTATFTFDADEAGGPTPPAGLDGTSVRFVAGPGVAQLWPSGQGVPALVVGRAIAPAAYSDGASFEALREHLLSLDLPEEVAAPLRTFNADGSTLPLPVPEGRFDTSTADVDGSEATVLTSRDRTVAGVVWVDGGVLTVVAGSLDADEVLDVARSLR